MNETIQMNDSFGPLPTPPPFKFNRMEDSVVGGPLTLDRACKEGYLSDVRRIVLSGNGGPADKLKDIRSSAKRNAEEIRMKIDILRNDMIELYLQFGNDDDLSREQVTKMFTDAENDLTRTSEEASGKQRPKILRDYIKRYSEFSEQVKIADHTAGNAEAAAVDERSNTVSIIVVDYQKPGNDGEPSVGNEVRSSRHLLEHVVIAQDGQITELRNQFCALIGTLTAHAEKQTQEINKLIKFNEDLKKDVADLKNELSGVKDNVSQLQEDFENRPLVVPLIEHANAKECLLAGYDPVALLRAGFSFNEIRSAGVTSKDLKLAGFPYEAIEANGFGCGELLIYNMITWADIERIWRVNKTSSIERLAQAGLSIQYLAYEWTKDEIKAVFPEYLELVKRMILKDVKLPLASNDNTSLNKLQVWKSKGWASEIKEWLQISNPTTGKKLGLTFSDMQGMSFSMQAYCDSGDPSGKPFSSKDILKAMYGQTYAMHSNLSEVWNSGWVNVVT
jgi:hypothetical protein